MIIYNIQTQLKLNTEYILGPHEKHVPVPHQGKWLCVKFKDNFFLLEIVTHLNPYITQSKAFIMSIYQHAIVYVAIVNETLTAHAYSPIHKIKCLQVNTLGINNRN